MYFNTLLLRLTPHPISLYIWTLPVSEGAHFDLSLSLYKVGLTHSTQSWREITVTPVILKESAALKKNIKNKPGYLSLGHASILNIFIILREKTKSAPEITSGSIGKQG